LKPEEKIEENQKQKDENNQIKIENKSNDVFSKISNLKNIFYTPSLIENSEEDFS